MVVDVDVDVDVVVDVDVDVDVGVDVDVVVVVVGFVVVVVVIVVVVVVVVVCCVLCRSEDKDKNKDSIECWNCGKRGHYSKDCKNTNKGGSKGKHRTKTATDAHNLDSTKPANAEPEGEIGGFDMIFLDVDALQQRESEWIKIGVDTGAGKTAWPQSVTYGKKFFWPC